MNTANDFLQSFADYVEPLDGDDLGETQVFFDKLFQTSGHSSNKEVGAFLKFRVKKQIRRAQALQIWTEKSSPQI